MGFFICYIVIGVFVFEYVSPPPKKSTKHLGFLGWFITCYLSLKVCVIPELGNIKFHSCYIHLNFIDNMDWTICILFSNRVRPGITGFTTNSNEKRLDLGQCFPNVYRI